jgi:hypothetical protein
VTRSKTHPHLDMPSDDDLLEVVTRLHPQHAELYLGAHRLVLEAVPGVRFEVDQKDGAIGYGARQFGYGGWGMAALSPHRGWVSLFLMRGAELADPDAVLEGGGKAMRHVKLRSTDDLAGKAAAIRSLLDEAVRIGGA